MFSIVFVPISQPCERPSRQVAAARRGLAAPRRGLAAGRRTVAAASSRHNRPPLRVAATIPMSPLARGVTSGINSLPTPLGIIWGQLGNMWVPLRIMWGPLQIMWACGAHCGPCECHLGILARFVYCISQLSFVAGRAGRA